MFAFANAARLGREGTRTRANTAPYGHGQAQTFLSFLRPLAAPYADEHPFPGTMTPERASKAYRASQAVLPKNSSPNG